jgi:transcriptional regulator with XRE-family HTH domain
MKKTKGIMRNAHFLGTKIRNLRKRNNLTMEDLSARCIKNHSNVAPSVSYLSMIERGKRFPSEEMLAVIAQVFQKEVSWFLDDTPEEDAIKPVKGKRGGISGMSLEPKFLFSNDILESVVPEMLSQTGASGLQFAHLLIRAHQEQQQNHFPDLERAAEEVGRKQMPLSLEAVIEICKDMGLEIHWFDRLPDEIQDEVGGNSKNLVRSFFSPPNRIYVNSVLKLRPMRLKYDLAVHIGHRVLHGSESFKSVSVAGGGSVADYKSESENPVDVQDILNAWRDFECSFFASALLCPKVPFRQLLDRYNYEINVRHMVQVSASVVMRRMTAVSPYPHWHYFDAYPPGKLKAVYRGNGIPLPWGNMRMVQDPCQHWAVFRMIDSPSKESSSQISILETNNEPRIYSCESVKVHDLAGNSHVLCAGLDLNPAIESQGGDAQALAFELKEACLKEGGTAPIPASIKKELMSVAKILNVAWVERGIDNPARLICPRNNSCPRNPCCYVNESKQKTVLNLQTIQEQIIRDSNGGSR